MSFSLGLIYSCQKTSTIPNNVNANKPATQISSTPSVIPTTIQVDSTTTVTKALKINDVPAFITANCTYCHSTTPNKDSGRTSAAAGITFDSEQEMIKSAISIKRSTVTDKSMPIGKIKITDKDRITIGKWLDSKTTKVAPTPSPLVTQPVTEIKTAQDVITKKCAYCHATTPDPASGYAKAPMSITFNSEQEMLSNISKINQSTLIDKNMPIGNITLSDTERSLLSTWISSQNTSTTPVSQQTQVSTATDTITKKCTYCHATTPDSSSGYSTAPMSITFNSEQEMLSNISKINQSALVNKSMPIGNITLTDTERTSISDWIKANSATNPVVVKTKTPIELITEKCAYCHATTPDPSSGYTKPPKRVVFDTEKEMTDSHNSIHSTIQKKEMPINNITMTDQERAIVLQWAEKIEADEKKQSWFYRIFH